MSKGKGPNRGTSDYTVGKGKPPSKHQFRPGQSGNPGGRKKRPPSQPEKYLVRSGPEQIEIVENGIKRKVPLVEALSLSLVKLGLSGDIRAINLFYQLYERYASVAEICPAICQKSTARSWFAISDQQPQTLLFYQPPRHPGSMGTRTRTSTNERSVTSVASTAAPEPVSLCTKGILYIGAGNPVST